MVSLPHSFVLADLFDVEAMSLEVPDHVLEEDGELEWIVCPTCNGEQWLEVEGSPYRDAALDWNQPDLIRMFKPCLRCQDGEVLEPLPVQYQDDKAHDLVTWYLAA